VLITKRVYLKESFIFVADSHRNLSQQQIVGG